MPRAAKFEQAAARRVTRKFSRARVLVVGDVMLDHFLWGDVSRISPEAPVPVVDFRRESFMPGGAGNVARNLAELGAHATLLGVVGNDPAAARLKSILAAQGIDASGLTRDGERETGRKIRVVAHQQQVVRVDRETRGDIAARTEKRLLAKLDSRLGETDAVIVCDYGKGVVTQTLLDGIRERCRARGVWLSLDPKPVHRLALDHLSLLTPNRKEFFALAEVADETRDADPLKDTNLMLAAKRLMKSLEPALMLVTLSELGMLLCRRDGRPFHIPTIAREVFDVSGAGDTVIASFTLAIAAGASPLEAALISNHAAGIVVGKVGTATVTPAELIASFAPEK